MSIAELTRVPSCEEARDFFIKWTPRTIAIVAGGYYGLGVAYELGLMAAIDQLAISILKEYVGYMGLGAIMPTFQWYAAWAVRIVAGLITGEAYETAEKTTVYAAANVRECFDTNASLA